MGKQQFKVKICRECREEFIPAFPAQVVHHRCRPMHYRKSRRAYMKKWRTQIKNENRDYL